MGKPRRRNWSVVVLALAMGLGASACATADLRSDALALEGVQTTPERAKQGRALLEQAAQHYGAKAWEKHQTAELVFRDDWDSALAVMLGIEPWDEEDLVQMRYQTGTFNVRVDILDGPRTGEVQGIQAWKTYTRESSSTSIDFSDNEKVRFILPALSYLFELPLRLRQATVVLYDGEQEFNGQSYDVVLATWGSPEPNAHDQYRVWINQRTGLIDIADYTVRDQGSFFDARIIYSDIRDVAGVKCAYEMTITNVGSTKTDAYLHQMRVDQVRFDSFPVSLLYPDKDLAFVGDTKVR